jgi:hypothetical protein
MDPNRFDSLSRLFAGRRLSRRQAMITGGAAVAATGLVTAGLSTAAAAQEATPDVTTGDGTEPEFLFVQSFQAGSIAAKEGEEGRYTLNLEGGMGQTIFFSDRPNRIVGAETTQNFLDTLGFPDDNPPNAALVIKNEDGATDIAVIELFSPVYDEATQALTYEIEVLENWEKEMSLSLQEAPADLASLESSFGAAHLFIDGILDCPDSDLICYQNGTRWQENGVGRIPNADHDGFCVSSGTFFCYPCKSPDGGGSWADECNRRFADSCNGNCTYFPTCTSLLSQETGCSRGNV